MVQDGIKLASIKTLITRTPLVGAGVSPKVTVAGGLTLCFLFLTKPERIMLDDVVQVFKNRFAPNRLGVITGDDADELLILLECVSVVKEQFVCLAADNDSPLAVWGPNMQLPVFQVIGYTVLLAELVNRFLLLSQAHANQ